MTYVIEVSQMFVKSLFKKFLKKIKKLKGTFTVVVSFRVLSLASGATGLDYKIRDGKQCSL